MVMIANVLLKKLNNFKADFHMKPNEILIDIGNGSLDPIKVINFLYPK